MVATTILRGDVGPGEVQRQQQGSGGLGVAGTGGLTSNATGPIGRSSCSASGTAWSFIG